MATTMKRLGAIGLVTDGGVRDIVEVRALGGFHYYGAGLVVAHGNPLIYDVGAEVTISGVTIRPGDLLHGDENGITAVPEEIADKVATQALKIRESEQNRLGEILSPEFHKQFERLTKYE
jgi:regulator of RNase E activity RraA